MVESSLLQIFVVPARQVFRSNRRLEIQHRIKRWKCQNLRHRFRRVGPDPQNVPEYIRIWETNTEQPLNTLIGIVEKRLKQYKKHFILERSWMKIEPEVTLRYILFFNRDERNPHITVSKYYQWSVLQTCISWECMVKIKIKSSCAMATMRMEMNFIPLNNHSKKWSSIWKRHESKAHIFSKWLLCSQSTRQSTLPLKTPQLILIGGDELHRNLRLLGTNNEIFKSTTISSPWIMSVLLWEYLIIKNFPKTDFRVQP